MKFGVLKFPGSNCDQDAYHTLKDVLDQPTEYLWHQDSDLKGVDCVVVPGGFSYGDYLRCGAIARFSPAMEATQEFASRGGLVLGICNGFQVLCESHLLPGALLRNQDQKFVCKQIHLRTEKRRDAIYEHADAGPGAASPNCSRRRQLCLRRPHAEAASRLEPCLVPLLPFRWNARRPFQPEWVRRQHCRHCFRRF